ncbi:MAG: TetR family transcriptional regulator [Actinocatenispora sp.]
MTVPAGPRRADVTRAAILAAARSRFATDGYERATIRAIAADAGIDPALVMRHYGNKEKLFAAAAEFDLRLPDLSTVPADEYGEVVIGHFLRRWEEDETFVALLRAAATNEAARERLTTVLTGQVVPAAAAVCPTPEEAPRHAGLLATQMLGLALCRYVLRLPPIATMPADEVIRWIAPTAQRYLTGAPMR